MSEWNQVVLDDVSSKIGDGLHGTPTYDDKGLYSFINGNNLLNGRIVIKPETKRITEEEYLKIVKPLDDSTILISINGTIGNVAKYRDELCALGKSACYINLDTNLVDRDFFYYECLSDNFQSHLENVATGTTIPNVPLKGIRAYKFNLPPLPEQKAIASVLSSLDDKIDLLHRQNKTLEAMAETLFRQWFIEEAKEELGDADLTQLIRLQSGYAFKSKDFQESGVFGVIKIKNISGNIIDIEQTDFVCDEVGLSTAQRFYVLSGQVLVAMTGAEIGKLGLVPKTSKKLLLNQRVGLLEPKFEGAEYLAYLHLKSEYGQDYIANSATGSAQPNISGSLIEACPFPKFDNSFLIQCGEQVQIYYEKVKENLGQIQTLENLRDTLLPKLMSGEVRVQYQTEEVA
jgi:type I restriction enzyme S subunit